MWERSEVRARMEAEKKYVIWLKQALWSKEGEREETKGEREKKKSESKCSKLFIDVGIINLIKTILKPKFSYKPLSSHQYSTFFFI